MWMVCGHSESHSTARLLPNTASLHGLAQRLSVANLDVSRTALSERGVRKLKEPLTPIHTPTQGGR